MELPRRGRLIDDAIKAPASRRAIAPKRLSIAESVQSEGHLISMLDKHPAAASLGRIPAQVKGSHALQRPARVGVVFAIGAPGMKRIAHRHFRSVVALDIEGASERDRTTRTPLPAP